MSTKSISPGVKATNPPVGYIYYVDFRNIFLALAIIILYNNANIGGG